MENLRSVIQQTAKIAEGHDRHLDESRYEFSDEELGCIKSLRESRAYEDCAKRSGGHDRHTIREALVQATTAPISVIESLSKKLSSLLESGDLGTDLVFPQELVEKVQKVSSGIRVKESVLYESMGSSTCDAHAGCEDHGMYGVGSGGDKDEPKGDADSGAKQKADQGDHSHTASKGYMDESEDDDEDDEDQPSAKMEAEPPKDAPLATKPTAADDADLADKVKHQKESAHAKADGGPKMDHKPQASDPGQGSATASKDQPEADGEVPSDHPDYEKAKKDGKGGDLDKGPSSPVNEASIEAQIVAMLAENGITAEHESFTQAFTEAFSFYVQERAEALAEAKKCEDDDEEDDEDMEEGEKPDFLKKDDDEDDEDEE